ncbi:10761_t:CDS:2, partial [Acaulospora morrowiae]
QKNEKDEQNLLADQVQFVWLIVSTHRFFDDNRDKPVIIPIKHPLYNSSTEICLFTKDPQKEFKELVATKGIKHIKKVIGLSKLRKKYKPYEAKRKLCDSYDLFLADNRITHLLPSPLGKSFFEKKKQPIPVELRKPQNFEKEIDKICGSTFMYFNPGTCL